MKNAKYADNENMQIQKSCNVQHAKQLKHAKTEAQQMQNNATCKTCKMQKTMQEHKMQKK